ncbi:hypothetical protein Goklo_009741 [Gossypium klotzschianum]|uniref:Uncharacterized protein n=1 Tax=Gossypium klotzschianum TaxID=34286 RepID=A0A7J8V3R8_9ROSI|nr:hypothetical protein [Gossypium klotzschianum]
MVKAKEVLHFKDSMLLCLVNEFLLPRKRKLLKIMIQFQSLGFQMVQKTQMRKGKMALANPTLVLVAY